jgi:hypothetical protein
MMNHNTTEVFFDDVVIPADASSARRAGASATSSTA